MLEFLLSGSLSSTLLVGVTVAILSYWLVQRWKYSFPPGPRGLPLIGNLLQIRQNELHIQAFEWSKKYGPVITIRLSHVPFVFVNKIDPALEVLIKKSTDFAARMKVPSIDVLTYGGKDIAFSSYGPTWKLHRRIASKALRSYMQGDALQRRVHDAIETAFEEMDKISGPVDPKEYLNFIVANILTGLCFGGKYKFDDQEIHQVLKQEDDLTESFGIGTLEDAIPGLRYIYKTKAFKQIEDLTFDICESFIRRKLTQAKETFNRDNIRHLTDNMLLARLEAEEEEGKAAVEALTEDHLLQTITDIFFAGTDTSRYTLAYAILHMVAFQDIQEKVQQEIDRVVGKDRLPGMADRSDLGYTEAVLYESMRLSSVIPTGIAHATACDTDIGGYRIPKGTTVIINHWALHHDPEAWNEVDRFIPERFLDENGKLGPKPKNWLPFSAGKRVCLGEFVAKPELHLIFASLMQRYKWTMESGRCPDLEPTGTSFTQSTKAYKVILNKRI